jgi:methylmalonyl-CoA mutase N-terminal domain/subunit
VREIGEAAYRHQQEVDSGARAIVGVNKYVTESPPIQGLLRVDPEGARHQVQRLQRLRRERDGSAVRAALASLEEVARGTGNTVPAILECVESCCTLGEVCQVFRKVFGEHEPGLAL